MIAIYIKGIVSVVKARRQRRCEMEGEGEEYMNRKQQESRDIEVSILIIAIIITITMMNSRRVVRPQCVPWLKSVTSLLLRFT